MGGEAPGMTSGTESPLGPAWEEATTLLPGTRRFLPWDGGQKLEKLRWGRR